MKLLAGFLIGITLVFLSVPASAQGGGGTGGWAIGGALGVVAAGQDDINGCISKANVGESGISTSQLGNAYEAYAFLEYRFGGSWLAFQFRPSFFYQNQSGTNAGGEKFEYGVRGYTFFPVARFYMLESPFIRFFSQVGIGIGVVSGEHKEGTDAIKYHGSDMGYLFGLGAAFCLWGGPHCITVEGNARYLSVSRVIADSVTGTPYGISAPVSGGEVEVGSPATDLSATLSGIQGFLGYTFNF